MYNELIGELRHYFADVPLVLQAADAIEDLSRENESLAKSVNEAVELLHKRGTSPKWIPVADIEHLPNTDSRVVGYFGGGAFNQLRWYDFVWTESDGTLVSENRVRDVMNEHCIAVFKLPEPPKEEWA